MERMPRKLKKKLKKKFLHSHLGTGRFRKSTCYFHITEFGIFKNSLNMIKNLSK